MNIVIIGAGNLATQLTKSLLSNNLQITQVYSRSMESAETLGKLANCKYTNDLDLIDSNSDLYIVSVNDDAIEDVISRLKTKTGIIVHTAGSVPMEIFNGKYEKYGVFYPLQTFSKEKEVDFGMIPVCIEASDNNTLQTLKDIGEKLSENVQEINSKDRKILHLSAVFVCNFVNYMYSIGEELNNKNHIDFKLLIPLIIETAEKVKNNSPSNVQTGPAIRNDQAIINKHMELLNEFPEFKKIYSFVSGCIQEFHKDK